MAVSKNSGSSGSKGAARREAARQKAAALRAAEAARQRRRRLLTWGVAALVAVVAAVAIVIAVSRGGSGGGSDSAASESPSASASTSPGNAQGTPPAGGPLTGPIGPEGIALEQGTVLAPVTTAATGATVDGIQCNSMEQAVYHIHAHLAIFVDGALRPVPGGIGVVPPEAQQTKYGPFFGASKCYYWLHTHAQDGIIHIEAPRNTTYTLGQFFAIWQQKLSDGQIGSTTGKVTAYVGGKPFTGDPASIPLTSREDIQLDIGTPAVPPRTIDWSKSQL